MVFLTFEILLSSFTPLFALSENKWCFGFQFSLYIERGKNLAVCHAKFLFQNCLNQFYQVNILGMNKELTKQNVYVHFFPDYHCMRISPQVVLRLRGNKKDRLKYRPKHFRVKHRQDYSKIAYVAKNKQ